MSYPFSRNATLGDDDVPAEPDRPMLTARDIATAHVTLRQEFARLLAAAPDAGARTGMLYQMACCTGGDLKVETDGQVKVKLFGVDAVGAGIDSACQKWAASARHALYSNISAMFEPRPFK